MPAHTTLPYVTALIASSTAILLVATLAVAFFTLRRHKPGHLAVSWYTVSLATLSLVVLHSMGIAAGAIALTIGRNNDYAADVYEIPGTALQRDVFNTIVSSSGVYAILVVVACRAAFWEFVRAPEFSGHKKAKRVFLGFDIFFAIGLLGTFILTSAVSLSPDNSGYDIWQLVLDTEFIETLGFGFPWIFVGAYILVVVGALYARRWARAVSIDSPVTNAMFAVMWPVLLAQTLFRVVLLVLYLIAFVSETGQGEAAFWLSIPWRAQQIAVLGVLAWVLYTKPVRVDEDHAQTLVDHPYTKTAENIDTKV